MMKRYASSTFTLLALVATLGACAPRTSSFSDVYEGPIETVAIVMETDEYADSRFQEVAYDQAVTAFYGHPYGRTRFDVVERERVESVLEEQGLVGSGFVDSSAGPQLGNLLGAQYLVLVELINLSADYIDSSGISLGGFNIGGGGYRTDAQVTLTMIDTETGLIVARSAGQANELVGESISLQGMYTSLGDEESAVLTVLPKAISAALNDLFVSLNS